MAKPVSTCFCIFAATLTAAAVVIHSQPAQAAGDPSLRLDALRRIIKRCDDYERHGILKEAARLVCQNVIRNAEQLKEIADMDQRIADYSILGKRSGDDAAFLGPFHARHQKKGRPGRGGDDDMEYMRFGK